MEPPGADHGKDEPAGAGGWSKRPQVWRPPTPVRQNPVANFLRRHIWVVAFVLGCITVTALRPFLRRVPEPPPVMYQLPRYDLTDHTGAPFTTESTDGKVWIASFVFTTCPSTCPAVTRAMGELQDRLRRNDVDVDLVSFTVDPETDSVEVLADYAESAGADPKRWRFVTGDRAEIIGLIQDGFKLGVGDKQAVGPAYDIAHSVKLALVGPDGGVRGFYGIDPDGLDEVYHRAQHVLRESRKADEP